MPHVPLHRKPKKKQPITPKDIDRGPLSQAWRIYKASALRMFGKHEGADKIEEEYRSLNPKTIASRARVQKALYPTPLQQRKKEQKKKAQKLLKKKK